MSDFVFFWAGEFSQWHRAYFIRNGMEFSCAEQWMMYNKAILFDDRETAEKIMATSSPKEQKALGRRVKGYDDDAWMERAYEIVVLGNLSKFSQNDDCMKVMLDTRDKELVEASPYDKRWGIGMGINEEGIEDKANWKGENLLGEALMEVRMLLLGEV